MNLQQRIFYLKDGTMPQEGCTDLNFNGAKNRIPFGIKTIVKKND